MAGFNIPEEDFIDANIYVVTKIGWVHDYDDKYYYRPEFCGGTPVNAFTIPALAEEYSKTKNCEWFINSLKDEWFNPGDYIDEYSHLYKVATDLCKGIDGLEFSNHRFYCEDPSRLKHDDIWPLIQELNIVQYEVVKVTLIA